jgi:uncharacterized membrane protein YjjP (DUF1212 family)
MIEFLSGAVTLAYLVAAGFFLRYWRKTGDRLFAAFAAAFVLFALNQFLSAWLVVVSEPTSLIYVLRVLGFVIIIAAVVDKNVKRPTGASRPGQGRGNV